MKTRIYSVLLLIFIISISASLNAQDAESWKTEKGFALVFGLSQPIALNGFNAEINYIHNRYIFGYSHGVSLDFGTDLVPDYLEDQGVIAHMPFSTGFGIGYRLYEWLNLRIEPKWHRFDFYYIDEAQISDNRITSDANNISIGLGLYGLFKPFSNLDNALQGITIAPSLRFWPTIISDFEGRAYSYQNKFTDQTEEIKTPHTGINFTPFILNISVGYSFRNRN